MKWTTKRVLVIVVTALVLMSFFEGAREFIFPHIGLWQSHGVSVVASAVVALIAGYFGCLRFGSTTAGSAYDESAKLHRFFIDNIDDAAFLIENSTIMDVSTVGTEILGYSREEMIGQSPTFVVSQRSKDTVQHRVSEGNEETYEAEGQRKDGSTFPLRVKGRELIYEGRRVRLTTIRDISQRKQAEVALLKMSRAVEQSPIAVFITDLQGSIEYVNAKFSEITGYSSEEAIGKNPRIMKSGETSPETYADLWQTIMAGREWRGEIKDRRKDGSTFWAYATIAAVKDDDDEITHYVSSHEDITRYKEAEQEAHSALQKASVANRAKSELLANMSHELRTPLNAIIGFSGFIKSEAFGPVGCDKYREYIDDIMNSGEHLLELVNEILDVSAIEAGKLELHEEELDLGALVDSSMRLIGPRANSGRIRLSSNISEGLPTLRADQRRMKQILLNLLSNAVKFTPSGGSVSLSVDTDGKGGHVFTITDTGIGMSPAGIAKALTPFGQVDSSLTRKHEGTGLGLPLTRGLVTLHGGALDIVSQEGDGTTVTVVFAKDRVVEIFEQSPDSLVNYN